MYEVKTKVFAAQRTPAAKSIASATGLSIVDPNMSDWGRQRAASDVGRPAILAHATDLPNLEGAGNLLCVYYIIVVITPCLGAAAGSLQLPPGKGGKFSNSNSCPLGDFFAPPPLGMHLMS